MKQFPLFLLLSALSLHAQPLTPARVEALRAEIRANFFVPNPLPALAAQTHRRFSPAPGVKAEAITYATEFGMRVPAILYLPDPLPAGGKIPGFVVVNGHGGDKYSWYSYYTGIAFARGGMAVLTYDQAGEGERNSERKSVTREHDELQGDAVLGRRLAGLMQTDVIQATSYLTSRPEVDPKRIGAGGYSMGSFVMAIGGAIESRLRAVVLVAGGNIGGEGNYWDSSNKLMCQGYPSHSLRFLGDQAAMLYALQAARGPLLIRNGRVDQVITPGKTYEPFFEDLQNRVAKIRGSRNGIFEFGFKDATGHRPYFIEQPAVLWLEKQLDFPNWTEAQIRALPEIHISEWAQQTGVPMDGSLSSEEREGGTQAVSGNVPGYQHEDLSVFSPAEWEKRKSEMAFSAWAAAARAAATK